MHKPSENKFRPMKSLKCEACSRIVNSDVIQVGQRHKTCGTSPHGKLEAPHRGQFSREGTHR